MPSLRRPLRTFLVFLHASLAVTLLPVAAGDAFAGTVGSGGSLGLPGELDRLLSTGRFRNTPGGFRIIALSLLADGCAARPEPQPGAARACVSRAFELALRTRERPASEVADALWLTHLNLLLGAAHRTGPCLDADLHRRLSKKLHQLSVHDPHAHAPSYAHLPYRWPADQAATLASLGRYDAAHGDALLPEALAAWKSALRRGHTDARWGLPASEMTGRAGGAELPRGCAQSFLTKYLAEVDAALAASWWRLYKQHFLVDWSLVAGFREWPEGLERPADVDSGPIVFGIGTSASALAIAAARAVGDGALADRLEAAAGRALSLGVGGNAAKSTLAEAIRFQARHQVGPGAGRTAHLAR